MAPSKDCIWPFAGFFAATHGEDRAMIRYLNRSSMEIKDIHTHHSSKEAIQNVAFQSFVPQPGHYYSVGIHPWNIDSGTFILPEEQGIIREKKEIITEKQVIISEEEQETTIADQAITREEQEITTEKQAIAREEQEIATEKQGERVENAEIVAEEQEKIARHPQVIAIGETGLDRLISTSMETQIKVFKQQIQLAEQVQKPLIIHAVRTFNELIRLKQQIKPSVAWIIHGFRGKKQIAEQLVKHGFYLSFGEKYQEEALRHTPLNRIFLETDESTQSIDTLYRKAAEILSLPLPEFSENIRQNIRQVFFSR